ncbi:MAG: dipeptidase [Clostridiales bacterium]|nr:dipeptidase [Eubacteriales bacterium]MDH7565113.1 dipeptidase [Clostridiales bacterium]
MIYVDAHCDTLTKIMELNTNLYENNCHVDLKRLKKYGSHVQFFAAFIEPVYCHAYAMKRAIQIIDRLYEEIKAYGEDISLCTSYEEIVSTASSHKVAALLSIEGGEALQGDLSALRMFYKLGVRSICLTWNHRNEIADGVSDSESGGGLTPFGREVVKNMNSLGMLVDVSHISERGFWDVLDISRAPVIASHSNARKLCSHKRNLTDEQILALSKNRGVMGINLYPFFLNDRGAASISEIIDHIEHIVGLAGIDCIGIGADFDGVECTPEGIGGVQDMEKVFNELLKRNYSEDWIEKIAGGNFLRVIKEVF